MKNYAVSLDGVNEFEIQADRFEPTEKNTNFYIGDEIVAAIFISDNGYVIELDDELAESENGE
jgi:hypothetical protein